MDVGHAANFCTRIPLPTLTHPLVLCVRTPPKHIRWANSPVVIKSLRGHSRFEGKKGESRGQETCSLCQYGSTLATIARAAPTTDDVSHDASHSADYAAAPESADYCRGPDPQPGD